MKIAVCGSNFFWKEMRELKAKLEVMGHDVTIPFSAENQIPRSHWDNLKKENLEKFVEKKGNVSKRYFDKIRTAEAVLVFNPEKIGVKNYIGGNTLMEIGIAFDQNKKIFVLNELPEESSFHDELVMVRPVCLKGDLTKIK